MVRLILLLAAAAMVCAAAPAAAAQSLSGRAGVSRGTDETVRPALWVSYERSIDRSTLGANNPAETAFSLALDLMATTDARFTPEPSALTLGFHRLGMLAKYDPLGSTTDVNAPASGAIREWGAYEIGLDLDASTNQAFTETAASLALLVAYENLKSTGGWALVPSVEVRYGAQRPLSSDLREATAVELEVESKLDWAVRWQFTRGDLRDMTPLGLHRVRWGIDSYEIDADEATAVRGLRESFNYTAGIELAPFRSWKRIRAFTVGYRHGAHPTQPRLYSTVSLGVLTCRGDCR